MEEMSGREVTRKNDLDMFSSTCDFVGHTELLLGNPGAKSKLNTAEIIPLASHVLKTCFSFS